MRMHNFELFSVVLIFDSLMDVFLEYFLCQDVFFLFSE